MTWSYSVSTAGGPAGDTPVAVSPMKALPVDIFLATFRSRNDVWRRGDWGIDAFWPMGGRCISRRSPSADYARAGRSKHVATLIKLSAMTPSPTHRWMPAEP